LSGSDFTIEIAKLAAQRGYKLFLLGGREGVAQEAADYLKALYPNIPIADAIAGPPFHSEEVTQELLKNSQPQIVLLALPQKEQMAWTYRVQKLLPECCVMGVGGSLDFIIGASAYQDPTGKYKAVRAPFWMRRRGLEWLWRLFTQPWRYRRIFSAVVKFVNEVVREGR
jgi:N-acetylglucosaminyldiphosphoundecaprenol N-acetyl-beta-D-mannosaminyltransferase